MSKQKQGSPAGQADFSPLRTILWPIHNYELKKFLPMGIIMFCLLFNYTILRDLKDSIVVNASGAGTIPFLKAYCVTPAAILFVILYMKMYNVFGRENIFYAVVSLFLIYFGAYGFIIHPNAATLQASPETIAAWHQSFPALSNMNDVIGNWAYSSFYVMSEIWGSSMIGLSFWQFANQITRMTESKRFYPLFVVLGNVALIFSGEALIRANDKNFLAQLFPGVEDPFTPALKIFMGMVVILGIVAMAVYKWMHTSVLTDPKYYDEAEIKGQPKKKKEKPSLMESMKIIFSSPELGLITLLLLSYGVTINLIEVQWKEQLKFYAEGDRNVYAAFMGMFSQWNGIITILFGWFIGSSILRRVSWFSAAAITPLFMVIGGVLFFAFILFKSSMGTFLQSFLAHDEARNAVIAATFLGFAVVVMAKSVKYTLFDPTKEMAYIPLSEELRSKGKAAVDVIGGRAGKSGGALVQSWLLMLWHTKDVVQIAPVTAGVFLATMILWLFAVKGLSRKVAEAQAASGTK